MGTQRKTEGIAVQMPVRHIPKCSEQPGGMQRKQGVWITKDPRGSKSSPGLGSNLKDKRFGPSGNM